MTKIREIVNYLENLAPPAYQESYDNSQLLTGNIDWDVKGVLITLDCTENVIEEAISNGANLVVAHHPVIFKGLKKITGSNYVERTVIKAIKNDIAIYAIHTNLDNVVGGVNKKFADLLELKEQQILLPKSGLMHKLVVFVPEENTRQLLDALHKAGAGNIGNYEGCSFRVTGTGAFEPNDQANPHLGQKNQPEEVQENRIEIIFPFYLKARIIQVMRKAHPYEEVAYYLQELENISQEVGSGMIGMMAEPKSAVEFLGYLKDKMELPMIRHTATGNKKIQRVAICGGAGSFLIQAAIARQADIMITADIKYHEFFEADDRLIIADIGHYESERFTKELIYEHLTQIFTNFAVRLAETNTNPVRYYF